VVAPASIAAAQLRPDCGKKRLIATRRARQLFAMSATMSLARLLIIRYMRACRHMRSANDLSKIGATINGALLISTRLLRYLAFPLRDCRASTRFFDKSSARRERARFPFLVSDANSMHDPSLHRGNTHTRASELHPSNSIRSCNRKL